MWRISTRQRIILKMIKSQPFIKRVITVEIKIDKNASGALDQICYGWRFKSYF